MLPKPQLDAAIDTLRDRDEYKVIVQFIRDERDRMFADLGPVTDPYEVMKIAGGIARFDELLSVLQ
jgi:histidinol-phosphate/aromatic aminotransferase/cobyric acid decarboxylase-like protein